MELKPGDKLGDRFTLLSKLGEGGHGRGLEKHGMQSSTATWR
jgi:hypothetical protein